MRRNFDVQLDFVDAAIFLYIIGNDDRKFYIGKNDYKNLMIAIDNGKGSVTKTTRSQQRGVSYCDNSWTTERGQLL